MKPLPGDAYFTVAREFGYPDQMHRIDRLESMEPGHVWDLIFAVQHTSERPTFSA